MLYIMKTDNSEVVWDEKLEYPDVPPEQVKLIQADGHEARFIKNLFGMTTSSRSDVTYTVPVSQCNTQLWYGDIARTIHITLYNMLSLKKVRPPAKPTADKPYPMSDRGWR